MNTFRPIHFDSSAELFYNSSAVRVAKVLRTLVGRRLRAVQLLPVLGEQIGMPLAVSTAVDTFAL
jgi:hypothetical protein